MVLKARTIDVLNENYDVIVERQHGNEYTITGERDHVVKVLVKELKMSEADAREELFDDMPEDYEQCGYCGFDHEYEYADAKRWHSENDELSESIAHTSFDKFMDRILKNETTRPKIIVENDSKQRLLARTYQDRPLNKTRWS